MPRHTPPAAPGPAAAVPKGLRTVGVEQELLLVDPESGAPVAVGERLLAGALRAGSSRAAQLAGEVKQEQIEVITPPRTSLVRVADAIVSGRRIADAAARRIGARAVALGTSVLGAETHLSRGSRYATMASQFGMTMREQLTCGLHVHVGVDGEEEGVAVLDRIRPWLPALLALSGNSPFWCGERSGYHSFRYQAWARWPSSGPTELFGSARAYRMRVRSMLRTGAVRDPGMIYFDARLSHHLPTVEVRVPDVCMDAEHAVAIAALTRALVESAARDWRDGVDPVGTPASVLRLAMWTASRYGVREGLVDPWNGREVAARVVIDALMRHADAALRRSGDRARTAAAVSAIMAVGTGAERQLRVLRESGDLRAVVADAMEVTHRGIG